MMRLTIGFLLLGSTAVFAAPHIIHTPPALELNVNSDLAPACFYADQRYSKGAIIEMAKQPYICEGEKSFEQNGRLSWQPFPLSVQIEQKLTIP
ncbi:DUF1496 domain-containing protein [Oceanisphaera sp. IT1-181]|uniref:DUF1496 domain-containing protein n=1 Tax=Oceanisphaera sp. IT1-181 TaxID=3081199 RepID=UPI0029CA273D|nr:DUF1496 domain-containing protein [Oceanisphaera sp. IT1-181]